MIERDELHGIRAALFDLDGTLFDSTHVWDRVDIEFLKKRGYVPTAEYKNALAALGNRELAVFTVEYYGLSETPEMLMREWADLARHEYENKVELFPGVREYLEQVHSRGIAVCAVTSLARELAEPCLSNNGVLRLFKTIVTADDSGLSKTSSDIYSHAASLIGVQPRDCVAFDDVSRAICSAKAAGMTTVLVRGDGAYECGGEVPVGAADFIIDNFEQAPILLPD